MGSNPYCYFTRYSEDIAAALEELREQEFHAGRYDPALQSASPPTYTFEQTFPPGSDFPSPGAQHGSIHEAFEASEPDGTGSILDIFGVASEPSMLHASPLSAAELTAIFGSAKPSREDIEIILPARRPASPEAIAKISAFWDPIDRGEARYLVVHSDSRPTELFFAGMSID